MDESGVAFCGLGICSEGESNAVGIKVSGHSRVKELEGNEGPLIEFDNEEPVAAPLSPIGRPISE